MSSDPLTTNNNNGVSFRGAESDPSPSSSSLLPQQKQLDLSRLFSDVSRTVSGIRNILGSSPAQTQPLADPSAGSAPSSSLLGAAAEGMPSSAGTTDSESSMPFGGLFGGSNVCFKTCGMEDIQFAARRAGEMFLTMKICMVILTVITVICALLMTATVLYYMYSRNQKRKEDDRSSNCASSCAYTVTTPSLYSGPVNRGTRRNQQVSHSNISPTSNSQMVASVKKFGTDLHE